MERAWGRARRGEEAQVRWTRQEAQPWERQEHEGGRGEGLDGIPGEPRARGAGRKGGERGEAGRLDGARGRRGRGGGGERPRAARAASTFTPEGTKEAAGGAEPWARGEGVGEEGGGVSQAMEIDPTARTGETGAGEGAAGEGRPQTTGAAARRPAGGGGLNAGSSRGQTFLLSVFLLNWARVESGELRTSST